MPPGKLGAARNHDGYVRRCLIPFCRAMANAAFEKRQKLANLLINSVTLYPDKAVVQGNIPLTNLDALSSSNICWFNSLWAVAAESPKLI